MPLLFTEEEFGRFDLFRENDLKLIVDCLVIQLSPMYTFKKQKYL